MGPTNTNQLVLLVDDDRPLLTLSQTIFTQRGHRVLVASDLEESAHAIHQHTEPMWAFIDLNLRQSQGDNSGSAILGYIRDVAHHRVAAHAWTGDENKAKWTEALRAGAISVLSKFLEDPEYLVIHVEQSDTLRLISALSTDSLTGLYNLQSFRRHVERDLRMAFDRGHLPVFSMLAIDADHFKQINDVYGHRTGDEALRVLSGVMRAHVRQSDHLCRRSGDEFLVCLPGVGISKAEAVGRKLQSAIAATPFSDKHGASIPLSITFGVAQLVPREDAHENLDDRLTQLIDEADSGDARGLTRAKAARATHVRAASRRKHAGHQRHAG